ncbi:MAG: FAD-binding oxidoreductase, partial [Paralcaligenes sp.]
MQAYTPYATTSGWNQITKGSDRGHERKLSSDLRIKFAIVGAGFAGAAVARRLCELYPDDEIVLLDALPAAEGSAGRSSGFMLDRADAKIDVRGAGPESDWHTDILQAGRAWLEDIVSTQHIRCDWRDIGHYKTSTTALGAKELNALLARLDEKGLPYRQLSGDNIHSELGASHCTNAAWFPNCVLIQPAELIHGLLATLPAQVTLYTESPVRRLDKGAPHTLIVGQNKIQADIVIFCNNVTLPFFGYGKYRQITVYTYAGMTPELTAEELDKLGQASDWGATPAERLGPTTRKLNSRRFLFRAGFSYKKELSPDHINAVLRDMYAKRYPQMRSHQFEYTWGGALSMTRNGVPIFGRMSENVYALSACNASGILKMTALGKLLAEEIAGISGRLLSDTLQFSKPLWIPPEPIRSLAVNYNFAKLKRKMRE